MKKLLIINLFFWIPFLIIAQTSHITGVVKTVKKAGTVPEKKGTMISLYVISDGANELVDTTRLLDNGLFAIGTTVKKDGFYVIGIGEVNRPTYVLPVYLKPNDRVEVGITDNVIEFTGNPSPENKIVERWRNLTYPVSNVLNYNAFRDTYKTYLVDFEALAGKSDDFKKSIKTPNQKFNHLMNELVSFDLDLFALCYMTMPANLHATKPESFPAYFEKMVVPNRFPNDDVLSTMNGQQLIVLYTENAAKNEASIDKRLTFLSTGRQKSIYLYLRVARRTKVYEKYKEMMEKYGKYFVIPEHKKYVTDLGETLSKIRSSAKAPNFICPDQFGKSISLSDFIGKVVLIDIWATWCGPCKEEIPSLIKLEEEMHGSNIVFISLSVDEAKDKSKWLQMLKDMNLGGIQLFAGGWGKETKDYNVSSIPRFIVIDKQGNIVTVDGPRPSSSELKRLLQAEIAK